MTVEQVIEGGYCVGCGVCAGMFPELRMTWNKFGDKEAYLPSSPHRRDSLASAGSVCPFSSARNETDIASAVFCSAKEINRIVGRYSGLFIGYSYEYRKFGSSGGVVTHLLANLLTDSQVDGVFCVGPTDRLLAEFRLVTDVDQLMECSTSFYHPVSLEDVLTHVRNVPGRYAVTGVPCFHKAIRLARESDRVLDERIVMQVGIVCGQMKSADYAEYLGRRSGKRTSSKVQRACFRGKENTTSADNYRFTGHWMDEAGGSRSGSILAKDVGVNWAMSYFKPKACDYCDDVFAECADVAVMDAWLPTVVDDPRGASLVIARSNLASDLLDSECKSGRINLSSSTVGDLVRSQEAGLRHRREGLRFRLAMAQLLGFKVPAKRVNPSFRGGLFLAAEMLMRDLLRRSSRIAFRVQRRCSNGLMVFDALMLVPLMGYKIFGKIRRRFSLPGAPSRDISAFYLD